jgi:uncharacterized membrane protein
MPEILPIGWFHTVMGIIALVSGGVTLAKFKEITPQTRSGQIYLAATLITAGTALAIFQRGAFGPGHALAVMTLLALFVGTVASRTELFVRQLVSICASRQLLRNLALSLRPRNYRWLVALTSWRPGTDIDRRPDFEDVLPRPPCSLPDWRQSAIALDKPTAGVVVAICRPSAGFRYSVPAQRSG